MLLLSCAEKLQNFISINGGKGCSSSAAVAAAAAAALELQAASSLFSLASVPLINSCLSSVTNVSLPSSSPGEEGGVFNVQFVLWIDVCWHRLPPAARTERSQRSTAEEEGKKAPFCADRPRRRSGRRRRACGSHRLTDTRRSAALMEGSGR